MAPDDMIVAAIASGLRPKAPPSRAADRLLIERALAAWQRIRLELFGTVRQIAV